MFDERWLRKNALFGCDGCWDTGSLPADELRVWKDRVFCNECFDNVCDEDELEWDTLPLLSELLWGKEKMNEQNEPQTPPCPPDEKPLDWSDWWNND